MSLEKPLETAGDAGVSGFESEEVEADSEMEKLEFDVQQMAQKILHFRLVLSNQLKSTFISLLECARPVGPGASEPGTSSGPDLEDQEQSASGEGMTPCSESLESAEKIQLLKDKISSNVTMIPTVLKRMKDCISTIDYLDSYNGIIHPAFKRKRTS